LEPEHIIENIAVEETSDLSSDEEDIEISSAGTSEPKSFDSFIHGYSKVTRYEAAIILSLIWMKYGLSYECMKSIIEAMIHFMPQENNFIESMRMLRRLFCGTGAFSKTEYCKKCKKKIISGDCCGKRFKSKFLNSPLEKQVAIIYQRKKITDLLTESFNQYDVNSDKITSFLDGSLYKDLYAQFFQHSAFNNAYTYYSDGVEIFKSAKSSYWPIYLNNENLPYKERFKIENMLLVGLWYDSTKPIFELIMREAHSAMYNFFQKGIEVVIDKDVSITVRGALMQGTGDLPARGDLINFSRFNSKFGCMVCKQRISICYLDAKNLRKNVKVYLYEENVPLRTLQETRESVKRAVGLNTTSFGVKGPSPFDDLCPDYVTGMSIDTMHANTGICKKLIYLWFDDKFSNEDFSLRAYLTTVDNYLKSIKKPNFLTRYPRSIKECLSFYTSAEFKNFLFYYSVPILAQILKIGNTNFGILQHYFDLVISLYMLHQEEITYTDVTSADTKLKGYVKDFQMLYGEAHMSANVHLLLHFASQVLKAGPLFVASCFPRESINGQLKKMVTGTRYSEEKMADTVHSYQRIANSLEKLPPDSVVLKFKASLHSNSSAAKIEETGKTTKIFALGTKYKTLEAGAIVFISAFARAGIHGHLKIIKSFPRLQVKKLIYTTEKYARAKKSASYCVEYGKNKNIGLIQYFVKVQLCYCHEDTCSCPEQFFALVKVCKVSKIAGLPENDFINELVVLTDVIAVDVKEFNTMCVFMQFDNDKCYYARRVNNVELE